MCAFKTRTCRIPIIYEVQPGRQERSGDVHRADWLLTTAQLSFGSTRSRPLLVYAQYVADLACLTLEKIGNVNACFWDVSTWPLFLRYGGMTLITATCIEMHEYTVSDGAAPRTCSEVVNEGIRLDRSGDI